VQADVFRTGSAITITKKSGDWITATALQLGSENIRWHTQGEERLSPTRVLLLKR